MPTTFPDGFLWGTATAAHQTEGSNWNNDWGEWEHAPDTAVEEPSGDATDHYWRYPSDLDLLVELGFGAYRFSLEWSRIEPEEGEWSAAQLDHYARMIDEIKAHHPSGEQAAIDDFTARFDEASVERKAEMLRELKARAKKGEDPANFSRDERKKLRGHYRQELVKRSLLMRILAAWLITVPASALMAALLYFTIRGMMLP